MACGFTWQMASMEKAFVGLYIPVVFPSSEMYRILPQRQELLTGMLHADTIGFHSHQYRSHFFTSVTRVLGVSCLQNRVEPCIETGGSSVRVFVTPLGVNVDLWLNATDPGRAQLLKTRFAGRKVSECLLLPNYSLDHSRNRFLGLYERDSAENDGFQTFPHQPSRMG